MYTFAAVLLIADAWLDVISTSQRTKPVPQNSPDVSKSTEGAKHWWLMRGKAVKKWVLRKRFLEVWRQHLSDEKQNIFQFLSPVWSTRGDRDVNERDPSRTKSETLNKQH